MYICVYIHTHLHLSTPFHSTSLFLLSDSVVSSFLYFFSSPVDLYFEYNVLVDPIEDKMSRTYQIETDISNV